MFEKYDLKKIMKEIEEDEKVEDGKATMVSQDAIKRMFLTRKKKKEPVHD